MKLAASFLISTFVLLAICTETPLQESGATRTPTITLHPDMKRAIKVNEEILKKGESFGDEFVTVNGKRRPTGFRPTSQFYLGAAFITSSVDHSTSLPRKFDIRKLSYSPVRGQIQGSCWAEGNVSAFELTWNFIKGTQLVFGVNDVIDCSGYGSAWSGGQLSMQYNVKSGLALEKDYRYTGKDGRCKKDAPRQLPLKSAPFLRGEGGKFPTEKELMAAALKYGAFEVCGSASSLGDGGRQDTPRFGVTNHCYAYAGWLDGKELGWHDAPYHIIKNSWGDGSNSELNLSGGDWGDRGYGYYRLSLDGVNLRGSTITEIQVADTGLPFVPPGPQGFTVETKDVVLTVTIDKNSTVDGSDLRENLLKVFGGGN